MSFFDSLPERHELDVIQYRQKHLGIRWLIGLVVIGACWSIGLAMGWVNAGRPR